MTSSCPYFSLYLYSFSSCILQMSNSLHSHSPKQVFKVLLYPKHLFFYTHLYVYKEPWGGVTHQRVLKNIKNLAVCGQISGFCQLN